MKQNRVPRNKPVYLWSINLQQRRQEQYTVEKGLSLQQVVLVKLDSYIQISEIRTFPDTIYKNKLKMA